MGRAGWKNDRRGARILTVVILCGLGKLVALAPFPVQAIIGFGIAGEALGFGIPMKFPGQLAGDVGDMTDADRAVPDFDIGQWHFELGMNFQSPDRGSGGASSHPCGVMMSLRPSPSTSPAPTPWP